MTAIGTVPAVYRRPGCRLADTCAVAWSVVGAVSHGDRMARQPVGCAGGAPPAEGIRIGRSGGSPMSVPASGPRGDGPGAATPRGDAVSERIALAGAAPRHRPARPLRASARPPAAELRLARSPRPGPVHAAGPDPPPAHPRGDRRRPLAGLGRHRDRAAAPGALPGPPGPGRRSGSIRTRSSSRTPRSLGLRPSVVASLDVRPVRALLGRPGAAARSRPSRCTAATSPRASATTASRPSASASPTASRTPSRSSPPDSSRPATWTAPGSPPNGSSCAIRSARRRTRCSSRSTA